MSYPSRFGTSSRGFTLLELLIVLAILGIMALMVTPWLLGTINRARLVSASKEVASLLQLARLEAIKESREALVLFDPVVGGFRAYVDRNADQDYTEGTDRLIVASLPLPRTIELRGPTDTAALGSNAVVGWPDVAACPPGRLGVVFRSDGSANCAGAFRFADMKGNFLETRIEIPATGRIVIQKWFGGGNPNENWFENGEEGNAWSW